MTFLPSALPWQGLAVFPALLVFVGVLLFSTATLAFYLKQTLSFGRLQTAFSRQPGLGGNAGGALLGAATPFCTCTAVPLFLGMLEVEVPLGPAVSFLLASPTINLGAVILLLAVFGWQTAVFYAAACLLAAVAVGWSMGRLPRRRALREYLWLEEDDPDGSAGAMQRAVSLSTQLTRRFLPWLALATLAGILVDALVPTSSIMHLSHWSLGLAIPLAALLGSLIYADILFLIPIGFALINRGASTPVVLTFMLAASGLSIPELVVLSRVLQRRLVVFFAGSTLATYVALGFGFVLIWR
jgi:uncharacterized membrane protein YraQ (UPF0718 family)